MAKKKTSQRWQNEWWVSSTDLYGYCDYYYYNDNIIHYVSMYDFHDSTIIFVSVSFFATSHLCFVPKKHPELEFKQFLIIVPKVEYRHLPEFKISLKYRPKAWRICALQDLPKICQKNHENHTLCAMPSNSKKQATCFSSSGSQAQLAE